MTLSTQQGGARVIFGNLLTLPVNDGLLYVEPFYIQGQASSTSYPQLNRVLVWYAGRVGVGQTLTQALTRAAQSAPVQTPAVGDAGTAETDPGTDQGLPTDAPDHDRAPPPADAGGGRWRRWTPRPRRWMPQRPPVTWVRSVRRARSSRTR